MENKNHLFRIAMAMAIMAFTILSSAQTSNNVLQQGKMKVWRDSPNQELNFSANISNQHRAKSQMVNVTIQMEYDASTCNQPELVNFFNTASSWGAGGALQIYSDWQTGTFTGQLPSGCYDIEATFISNDDKSKYIVINELVDIQSDTTIVINQSTATNHIEIISKKPNGDLFDPSIYEGEDAHIVYEGNIDAGFYFFNIFRKNDNKDIYTEAGQIYRFDIYINDISNRFIYEDIRNFPDFSNSIIYFVCYASTDFSFPLENDISDWEYLEETFQPSAFANNHKSSGLNFESTYNGLGRLRGGGATFTELEVNDETVKVYLNIPKRNDGYKIIPKTEYGHRYERYINSYDWQGNIRIDTIYSYHNIASPGTFIENGVKHYINNGPIYDVQCLGYNNEGGLVACHAYPGNPAFAFTEAEKTSAFGSGTPICIFANEMKNESSHYVFTYVGRYGEVREVDHMEVDLDMKINGTDITNDINNLVNQYSMDLIQAIGIYLMNPSRPQGEIDITLSNDNVIVDGLQGNNYAQIHIDETKEDVCSPSLTMLWFKNAEGKITDRFAKIQDGILEFSAGDFNAMYDGNISTYSCWFDCQKPDVEVYYAPYGEESWNELEVEEIPENFFMPGFGHFYRGSLAGVTGQALKGWFDLKIKLTDAAGNWQEQVISPAFKIDSYTTGISDVNSNNAYEVARYNLAGQRVGANTSGVVIVRYNDGTARKMIVK